MPDGRAQRSTATSRLVADAGRLQMFRSALARYLFQYALSVHGDDDQGGRTLPPLSSKAVMAVLRRAPSMLHDVNVKNFASTLTPLEVSCRCWAYIDSCQKTGSFAMV